MSAEADEGWGWFSTEPPGANAQKYADAGGQGASELQDGNLPRQLATVKLPEEVERRATAMLERARTLGDRRAIFAARREFVTVLRMIAQSLDAQAGTQFHTQALANGLRALDEADDFALAGSTVESDLHVKGLVTGHRTPVLKDVDTTTFTPLVAMQRYYAYAVEQLAQTGNEEPLAAAALAALGRAEMLVGQLGDGMRQRGPRSLALFQAALRIDSGNARAANELGVMLARRGQLEEALEVLEQSARVAPTPIVLQNLTSVKRHLAVSNHPQAAAEPSMMLAGNPQPSATSTPRMPPVTWVDPAKFAAGGAAAAWQAPPATAAVPTPGQAAAVARAPWQQSTRPESNLPAAAIPREQPGKRSLWDWVTRRQGDGPSVTPAMAVGVAAGGGRDPVAQIPQPNVRTAVAQPPSHDWPLF